MAQYDSGMKSMSAKEAKNDLGLLLDTARAEPVTIEKDGRPVAVVLSTEEYERLVNRAKLLGQRRSANDPNNRKTQAAK